LQVTLYILVALSLTMLLLVTINKDKILRISYKSSHQPNTRHSYIHRPHNHQGRAILFTVHRTGECSAI
jgi:hypothetical protein